MSEHDSQVRQTCTHHCSARGGCGQHFHGLGAFDAHLCRVNEGPNQWGAHSYDLEHLDGASAGLQAWTDGGWCDLVPEPQHPVTIWQLPMTERQRLFLAGATAQKTVSRHTSGRRGSEEEEGDE